VITLCRALLLLLCVAQCSKLLDTSRMYIILTICCSDIHYFCVPTGFSDAESEPESDEGAISAATSIAAAAAAAFASVTMLHSSGSGSSSRSTGSSSSQHRRTHSYSQQQQHQQQAPQQAHQQQPTGEVLAQQLQQQLSCIAAATAEDTAAAAACASNSNSSSSTSSSAHSASLIRRSATSAALAHFKKRCAAQLEVLAEASHEVSPFPSARFAKTTSMAASQSPTAPRSVDTVFSSTGGAGGSSVGGSSTHEGRNSGITDGCSSVTTATRRQSCFGLDLDTSEFLLDAAVSTCCVCFP
jgi:hypothetical protein